MTEKESQFAGAVEAAARYLAEADKMINTLWETGTLRLSEERIQQITLNFVVIDRQAVKIGETIRLFKGIAAAHNKSRSVEVT